MYIYLTFFNYKITKVKNGKKEFEFFFIKWNKEFEFFRVYLAGEILDG